MRWLALLVLSVALVAAGCGGGGNESAASTETTTEETTTDSTATEETTTESTGTTDLSGILNDQDCLALAGVGATFAQAVTGASDQQAAEQLHQLVDKVPDEIKADVQTLAAWFADYTAKLKDIGIQSGQTPTAAQLQQLQAAIADSNQQELQAASQRLQAWSTKNCTG